MRWEKRILDSRIYFTRVLLYVVSEDKKHDKKEKKLCRCIFLEFFHLNYVNYGEIKETWNVSVAKLQIQIRKNENSYNCFIN